MKRRWRWLAVALLLLLAGAAAIGYWKLSHRAYAVAVRLAQLQKNLPAGWSLQYSAPLAVGATSVRIDSLALTKSNSISLYINEVTFTPSVWGALLGTVRLTDLTLDSLALVLVKQDAPSPAVGTSVADSAASPFLRALGLQNRLRTLLARLPAQGRLRRGLFVFRVGTLSDSLRLSDLGPATGGTLSGHLSLPNDSVTCSLRLVPSQRNLRLGWSGGTKANWYLPALQAAYGVRLGGNAGTVEVSLKKAGAFQVGVAGRALSLQHPRLASGPVQFDRLQAQVVGQWLPDGLLIDSTRTFYQLNAYRGFAGGLFRATATDTLLRFSLGSDTLRTSVVLDSLPRGLLPHLEGMQATGRFRQHLFVNVSTSQPDSAQFVPTFWCDSCRVTRWGAVNPLVLNDTFTHRTYREQRRLRIAPGSPHFTPLADISPYVWQAVMVSEDGGFYGHAGFYPEMLGRALAANLAAGRIVRGGSTITMQLVKNVFLTPEKHLSRKVEEALLVWLIESQRLVPKRRMLEVYLNIIEWGPGVYGIAEASQYYFNRHPAQLYYPEGVFLAMIVPAPRRFRWHFDSTAVLRPHVDAYYQVLMDHLQRRGVISETERAVWNRTTFRLTGIAARELGQQPTPTWPERGPTDAELMEDLLFLEDDLDFNTSPDSLPRAPGTSPDGRR